MPKRVRSSPASLSTGIRVPIAVVASAEPVKRRDSTSPGQREQPAQGVREDERQQPSEDGQPERGASDSLEVDLVAREEEEHSEPEVREELDELVRVREAQHVGADQDPEQDLEDDHRQRHARRHQPGHERRHRAGEDDEEKGLAIDVDHRGEGRSGIDAPACS